jgi:hypothetical protein
MGTEYISHQQEDGQRQESSMFRKNDIVRFVQDYNMTATDVRRRAPKGTLGVVNGQYLTSAVAGVTLLNDQRLTPSASFIEKAPGHWEAVTARHALVPGVSLVRPTADLSGGGTAQPHETFTKGGVFVVQPTCLPGSRGVALRPNDVTGAYTFSSMSVFEVFVPDVPVAEDRAQAMTFATALELAPQFHQHGVQVRVRQRSWDTDSRYAAIDVVEGITVKAKLYTAMKAREYLAQLEAAQTPIDVVAVTSGYNFRFLVPNGNAYIPAPDGATYWTLREIQAVKGITRYNGQKYRLCTEVTRTVKPIVEA